MPLSQPHQTLERTGNCWAGVGGDRSHHLTAWGQLMNARVAWGPTMAWHAHLPGVRELEPWLCCNPLQPTAFPILFLQ